MKQELLSAIFTHNEIVTAARKAGVQLYNTYEIK